MPVAVKVPKLEDQEAKTDFLNEIKICQRLKQIPHANIVPYIGFILEGTPSLVMTRMVGDLEKTMQSRQGGEKLTTLQLLNIVKDVSAALAHLHKQRIIHRDIAARNVLLDENKKAYICDFGLSLDLPQGKTSGKSPNLKIPFEVCAPEALDKNTLTYSSSTDAYMFGHLLFEIFTGGRGPYDDCRQVDDMYSPDDFYFRVKEKVLKGETPRLPAYWPELLGHLVSECWNKDPDARPSMPSANARLRKMIEKCRENPEAWKLEPPGPPPGPRQDVGYRYA